MRLSPSLPLFTIALAIGFIITSIAPQKSFAFYTVQESGDILKESERQFAAEVQVITDGLSNDDGANLLARFDMGFDPDSNLRFVLGGGTTDFIAGAFYKWVPFPDFENQPAIGITFGAHLARYSEENDIAGRVIPFVSKKFDTDIGALSPYVSLPFGFSSYNDETTDPFQFVLGSRYRHPEFDSCDFNLEIGFDIEDAPAYISVGAIFPAF
jgi:hypothetical protein